MRNSILIIAEAGVNHNGNIDLAYQLIDSAIEAKVDIIKFQTFKTEKVLTKSAKKADYQISVTSDSETQFEMIKKLEFSESIFKDLKTYCDKKNIKFMSTPFDLDSIDFLSKKLNLETLKLPSGEINNAPFLLKAARTKKKIILSTGMSSLSDIEAALGVIAFGYTVDEKEIPSLEKFKRAWQSDIGYKALLDNLTILHCTTEYPAPLQDVNLKAIEALKQAFGLQVGYSDHTEGIEIPIAAAALGSVVIEKHFTLDRKLPGPDHKASLEPHELKKMVTSIRNVEIAMGVQRKIITPSEEKNILIARKSIVASKNIKKNEIFTIENITCKRPGSGVSPMKYWDFLGKVALSDYAQDEEIS